MNHGELLKEKGLQFWVKNYKLNSPLMIGSSIQESNALTHDHSASIVATISFDCGKSHLSSVIDMNRS